MPILRKRVKDRKIKQQKQQTLITSKILSVLEDKIKNKVNISSDEPKTKHNDINHQKRYGPVQKKVW